MELAFENPGEGPNVIITVTYTGAAGPRPDGTPDQEVVGMGTASVPSAFRRDVGAVGTGWGAGVLGGPG